jgi:ADP-ribosyl-[dinitrogen reductase] hydrolase
MNPNQQDRLRGIAVGAVIGDALGMPLEFQSPRSIHHLATEMESGPLPAGTFTDDTEMALALAESLQITSPLDPDDLAGRFTAWFQSHPGDVGIHTSHVLRQIAKGTSWRIAAESVQKANPEAAGNGSLMRCWPIAIARWENPSLLVAESRLQSEITHSHPDCINASIFLNLILHKIIQGSGHQPAGAVLRQSIDSALKQVEFDEDFQIAIKLAPVRAREELSNSGWVRHTMESALWAVLTTQSFEEALVQAVNLGWDADTTGCVTGAIAGAMYGLSAIPARWKDKIHGEYPLRSGKLWFSPDFITLADQLAELPGIS